MCVSYTATASRGVKGKEVIAGGILHLLFYFITIYMYIFFIEIQNTKHMQFLSKCTFILYLKKEK